MSKAALYAGLGQGLMSLGQGVSKAIETMTLEEMRQRNLEQNWAREDAKDAKRDAREDARWERQDELAQEQRDYQRGRDAKADERQQALMDIAKEERDDKKNSKVVDSRLEKDENGNTFEVEYNASGVEVSRRQLKPSDMYGKGSSIPRIDPILKEQIDVLNSRYESAAEYYGSDSAEAKSIQRQLDKLIGIKDESGDAPPQAIEMLMSDPSPEAKKEFKEAFGYLPNGLTL